tara:strand:+ start:26170 stop:26778 length:609 start_codon:yes stop_codon:yes gene_type:complete
MMKFWSIKKNKKIDVILIDEKSIHKGKITSEELSHFSKKVANNNVPEGLFEIPFTYIKRVENQENKKDIKVFYGDSSEEELTSTSQLQKNEIFTYLKEAVPNMKYSKELPSIFRYAKPQLFAILFTTGIFLWSLYYAIQIENGVEYEVRGTAGLLSMIFSIGLLGVVKVTFIFFLIIGIAVYSLIRRNRTRTQIEQLNRYKK